MLYFSTYCGIILLYLCHNLPVCIPICIQIGLCASNVTFCLLNRFVLTAENDIHTKGAPFVCGGSTAMAQKLCQTEAHLVSETKGRKN